MSEQPLSQILRLADLPKRKKTAFSLTPEAPERQKLAQALGISLVKKLDFRGDLTPLDGQDWQLSARLGATVVQPCVVTLAPVTTRIDVDVDRKYLARAAESARHEPDAPDREIPEDVTIEPLPASLDLGQVAFEALALNLPDYPRAPDAGLGEAVFAEPGIDPLKDSDLKPFAGLAELRNKLNKDEDE